MHAETVHFLEAVALDRPSRRGRSWREVTLAADLSAERNQPMPLPLAAWPP